MNIILHPNSNHENGFHIENVMFGERVSNNIIENSYFYNILYSNEEITLSNIHILFPLKFLNYNNYFNKYKLFFSCPINFKIINYIKEIEDSILKKFGRFQTTKTPQYKLYNQLLSKQIKVNTTSVIDNETHHINLLIKISGLWEDQEHYGIIYSFLYYPSVT